jgi:hypothetical protein
MKAIRQFFARVRASGKRRPGYVVTVAMGKTRRF